MAAASAKNIETASLGASGLALMLAPALSGLRPALTWRFARASLITTALAGYIIIHFLAQAVLDQHAADAQRRGQELASGPLRALLTPGDFQAPLTGAAFERFSAYEAENLLPRGTEGLTLWNREGRIIYSNDARQIGITAPVSGELGKALGGETVVDASRAAKAAHEAEGDEQAAMRLLVPVFVSGSDRPAGALELHQEGGPVIDAVQGMRWRVAGALVLAYGALLAIARRPARNTGLPGHA